MLKRSKADESDCRLTTRVRHFRVHLKCIFGLDATYSALGVGKNGREAHVHMGVFYISLLCIYVA